MCAAYSHWHAYLGHCDVGVRGGGPLTGMASPKHFEFVPRADV